MYHALEEIKTECDKVGIKYGTNVSDSSQRIDAGFTIKNGGSVIVRFICRQDENDVAVRIIQFISVRPESKDAIIQVANACNAKYRFIKFCVDSDNDLNVEFDFPLESGNVGPMAKEIFIRWMQICQEVYPDFMRALWS